MNICLIFNERPVLNRLRLVRTSNRSRLVLIGFLRSLIGPVRFFEVLGLWWTGLGLGLSSWRSKTETGPDFQSLGTAPKMWHQIHMCRVSVFLTSWQSSWFLTYAPWPSTHSYPFCMIALGNPLCLRRQLADPVAFI